MMTETIVISLAHQTARSHLKLQLTGWTIALPAGCHIISCRPLLLELTLSVPLTLDEEVPMRQEWHRDKRKCNLVILTRDLLLLDLDIVEEDRPSVANASPSRIPSSKCHLHAVNHPCPGPIHFLAAVLPPPPCRRRAATDVTMSRAAATALPPARCAPPQRRRQAATNIALLRCRHLPPRLRFCAAALPPSGAVALPPQPLPPPPLHHSLVGCCVVVCRPISS